MHTDLLKAYSQAHGTSGHEDAVRRLFVEKLRAHGDISYDAMGSVVCMKHGPTADAPRVLVTAHMDEVGFAVQHITPAGCLQIVPLGGWWTHVLLAQRVRILTSSGNEVLGIITSKPPHFLSAAQKEKVMPMEELYVDIGAGSADEVREKFGVALGDPIVPDSAFTEFGKSSWVAGKAFDNRAGCTVMTQVHLDLANQPLPCQLLTAGTVQEEVGCRGAVTMANLTQPDIAFILECAPAEDTPGFPLAEAQGKLGAGPQIRLLDPTALMHRKLTDFVLRTAREAGIPHQVAVRRSGGTDARSVQLSGTGVPSIVISTPARYIHSHNSILDLNDLAASIALVKLLVEKCDAATVAGIRSWE